MKHNDTKNARLSVSKTDLVPLLLWILIVFLTWLFMHNADHFLQLTPEALGKYFTLRWVLIAHITAGGGALVLGFVQFWPKLRIYNPRVHRIIGASYLLAILVSSVCAVILSFTTAYELGLPYAISLQVWVSVWISSTFIAYYSVLRKNFGQHREWMIRSYIVTLAFIVSGLALRLPAVQQLGSFEEISPSFFWIGWAVPLYVYEIIRSSKRIGSKR
jgi:hypothetical protein